MTIYNGWDKIDYMKSKGTNPDSENSIVVYATLNREKHNAYEPSILISQVITKESHEDFTAEELFPLKQVIYTDAQGCGGYGPVIVEHKDGSQIYEHLGKVTNIGGDV